MTGLGPVFASEGGINARRRGLYVQRSLFVALLLAALVTVWWGRVGRRATASLQGLAELGETFYVAAVGTQLVVVLLAAPAATAGAICLDRARGTLTHMLVTDLTDGEIVVGKLAARLVPVLTTIACGIPVLSLLALLGGVDSHALFGALVVTMGMAVLGCSLALALSLWVGRSYEALLGTYAVWGLWLLAPNLVSFAGVRLGLTSWAPSVAYDPFRLTFAPYTAPGSVGWLDYLGFLAVTLTASVAFTSLAVVRLRPVCAHDRVGRSGVTWTFGPKRWLRWRERLWRRLPGPSLDGNPVLWREWHRNRPSGAARAIAAIFILLAAASSASALAFRSEVLVKGVNAFQVSIGLLVLSVTASTSLAEERARGSLDVLLATPMSTRMIVLGKWLGAFRYVPALAVLPTLVVFVAAVWDVRKWPVAALMAAFVMATGAAVSALGVLMATRCNGLGRAVGGTVAVYILLTVGWMGLVMAMTGPHPYGYPAIAGSPFFGPIVITSLLERTPDYTGDLAGVVTWIVVYLVAVLVLLSLTLVTFDRRLGRAAERRPASRPRRGGSCSVH